VVVSHKHQSATWEWPLYIYVYVFIELGWITATNILSTTAALTFSEDYEQRLVGGGQGVDAFLSGKGRQTGSCLAGVRPWWPLMGTPGT
jgi:hypothetical protein